MSKVMRCLRRSTITVHIASVLLLGACGSDASPSDPEGDGDDASLDAGASDGDDGSEADEPGEQDGTAPGDTDGAEAPDAGADGGEGAEDADGEPQVDAGSEPADEGGEEGEDGSLGGCLAHNGEVRKDGTAQVTLTNVDANLDVAAPASLDCQVTYDPAGGVGTGFLEALCFGLADPYYYGINLHLFATPTPGRTYLIGDAGSVPDGMGGYKSNEEVSLDYEEGPHCESKQGKVKAWDAQRASSALLSVDSLEDGVLTFSLSQTSFAPGTISNEKGTGGFQLSFTATATVAGL